MSSLKACTASSSVLRSGAGARASGRRVSCIVTRAAEVCGSMLRGRASDALAAVYNIPHVGNAAYVRSINV